LKDESGSFNAKTQRGEAATNGARLAVVDFHSGGQPFPFEPFLVSGYDAQ